MEGRIANDAGLCAICGHEDFDHLDYGLGPCGKHRP